MTAVGVCGFPRSGTSMMMRMLDAGGVPPVVGSSPAGYELALKLASPDEPWWWERLCLPGDLDGHAVKFLDEFGSIEMPPDVSWRMIWMDRDPREQAASQIKLLQSLAPDVIAAMGAPDPRVLQRSLRNDRANALAFLRGVGDVRIVSFEDTLSAPLITATLLAQYLIGDGGIVPPFDIEAAAAVVLDRGPECQPALAIEVGLADAAGSDLEREWGGR